MPCDSVITISQEVGKWNEVRANEAIKQAGLQGVVVYRDGILYTNASSQELADSRIVAVKKAYSELVIREASKKFGWTVKSTATTKTGLKQLNLARL
jgi:hypothetical protein